MAEETSYVVKLIMEVVNQGDAALSQISSGFASVTSAGTKAASDMNKAGVAGAAAATGFDKLKGSAAGVQSTLTSLPLGLGAAASGFIAAATGALSLVAAYEKITRLISESLDKNSQLSLTNQQLATVWQNMGRQMPIEALQAYSQAIVENSIFTRGQVAEAAKLLATFPNVTDELMPKALQAAADLASFRGMGIEEAAGMIARAAGGMVMGLQRMGVRLSATTKESKDFKAVLEDINRSVAGQATLTMNTYNNQLKLVEKQWNSLKTAFGEFLSPAAIILAKDSVQETTELVAALKKLLGSDFGKDAQNHLEILAHGFARLDDAIKKTLNSWLEWLARPQPKVEPAGPPQTLTEALIGNQTWSEWAAKKTIQIGVEAPVAPIALLVRWIYGLGEEAKDAEKKAAEGAEKTTQAVAGAMAAAKTKVNWDIEIKKAETYYARLAQEAKSSLEAEKTLVEQSALSKEQAEAALAALQVRYGAERIAQARREHDQMLALTRARYDAEVEKIKAAYQDEADRQEKLKPLYEKRTAEVLAIEQKLTQAIAAEYDARQGEQQKYLQQRREIQDQIEKEVLATKTALENLSTAGMNEYDKLQLKFQQAADTLKQAIAALPTAPEKAIELARQARDSFAGLQQDTANLIKNIQQTGTFYRDLEGQIRSTGLTGMAKRKAEVQEVQNLLADARRFRQEGLFPESEGAYKAAAQKAAALAQAPEGMSKEAARKEALDWVKVIKEENIRVAKERADQAIKQNESLGQKIIEAGDVILSGLQQRLAVVNDHIKNLTDAIWALVKQLGGTSTFKPSAEAQKQAGTVKGREGAETGERKGEEKGASPAAAAEEQARKAESDRKIRIEKAYQEELASGKNAIERLREAPGGISEADETRLLQESEDRARERDARAKFIEELKNSVNEDQRRQGLELEAAELKLETARREAELVAAEQIAGAKRLAETPPQAATTQPGREVSEGVPTGPGTFNALPFRYTSKLTAAETAQIDKENANFEGGLPSLVSKVTDAFKFMTQGIGEGAGWETAVDRMRENLEAVEQRFWETTPKSSEEETALKSETQKAEVDKLYAERMERAAARWEANAEKPIRVEVNLNGGNDPAVVDFG